jgi:hypothetical protein
MTTKAAKNLDTTKRIPKIPGLKLECGTTQISLSNSRILTKEMGKPALVVLTKDGYEWNTTAYWGDSCKVPRFSFRFNGFSWGYGGEGPNGLLCYLRELGLKVDITMIAKIKDEQLPKVFEI